MRPARAGGKFYPGCFVFPLKFIGPTGSHRIDFKALSKPLADLFEFLTSPNGGFHDASSSPSAVDESEQPLTEQIEAAFEGSAGSSDRQGYVQDARERKAIEDCAVQAAIRHYRRQGYSCKQRGKPYDLLCRKRAEERHVEVKGTKGEGKSVELTINEVDHARQSSVPTDLFIWGNIRVEEREGEITATGGKLVRHILNWAPDEQHLKAIRFEYHVPQQPS
jgi:hypothetical protein